MTPAPGVSKHSINVLCLKIRTYSIVTWVFIFIRIVDVEKRSAVLSARFLIVPCAGCSHCRWAAGHRRPPVASYVIRHAVPVAMNDSAFSSANDVGIEL